MKLLLQIYPRRWRDRYGDELAALLEDEPLTWRVRANVLLAGLQERLRSGGPPRVLWAWTLFVVGGIAFQKTSEHWQAVVPTGDRGVPTAAFDAVQVAAVVGSAAVLTGIALALPSFWRDLGHGGWAALRRPVFLALATTTISLSALAFFALWHSFATAAVAVFLASALLSLFAWTHAAVVAAERLAVAQARACAYLAAAVGATMIVMLAAAAIWFGSVMAHASSFVGAGQLAVVVVFMVTGTLLALPGAIRSLRV
ncbi:MAG TPA: hypothetical protein VLK36_06915 [Gaiellaceae bacterium]|nr:hypothetical protein [Gaiellaceae bacterium]